MSELQLQCLDAFPAWLKSLPEDARVLTDLLADPSRPERLRSRAAAALNHLLKTLDMVPEGVEDLGFIDDAFVLRVAVAGVWSRPTDEDANEPIGSDEEPRAAQAALDRLANEAALVEGFLGSDFERLVHYVAGLEQGAWRGRTVNAIVNSPNVCDELCSDVRAWAEKYRAPPFPRDPKGLVKVRAFLAVKLPS
jgi:uncharacterized membrane protein YkvA (DUF1232 family)